MQIFPKPFNIFVIYFERPFSSATFMLNSIDKKYKIRKKTKKIKLSFNFLLNYLRPWPKPVIKWFNVSFNILNLMLEF